MATSAISESDESNSEFGFNNYDPAPPPTDQWLPPVADFWEPQDQTRNAIFRALKPTTSHLLSQNEIFNKYPLLPEPLPFGRLKIFQKTHEYKTETDKQHVIHSKRYNITFKQQVYVDFACVADLNRPLTLELSSFDKDKSTMIVRVSSYIVPEGTSIVAITNNRADRRKLKRAVHRVNVDVNWLKSTARPDVADMIQEQVLGSKVMRVKGENIATNDALSLAITGKQDFVKGFCPYPKVTR